MRDKRAVSSVIGVILMVAVTVIIAAIAATFMFGMVDDSENTAPVLNIEISADTAANEITILHRGGESLTDSNTDSINVTVDGSTVDSISGSNVALSAGESTTISATVDDGNVVRVSWVSGEESSILASRTI